MSTRRKIPYKDGVYFVTFTCYKWLPLFELSLCYDMVYQWFDSLKRNGHHVVGYVTMPNHLHSLLAFRRSRETINTTVGNGKRFLAYQIVKRLKLLGEEGVLEKLADGVSRRERKKGKLHSVFEQSFDWKECTSDRFIEQKLDYIHDNPCRGVWNLAASPHLYKHSSAGYYLTGERGVYDVLHYAHLNDIDLTLPLPS